MRRLLREFSSQDDASRHGIFSALKQRSPNARHIGGSSVLRVSANCTLLLKAASHIDEAEDAAAFRAGWPMRMRVLCVNDSRQLKMSRTTLPYTSVSRKSQIGRASCRER